MLHTEKHVSTAIARKAGVIVQDPLPGAEIDVEPVDEADNLPDLNPVSLCLTWYLQHPFEVCNQKILRRLPGSKNFNLKYFVI